MKDENKTKKQLIDELVGLRQRITNLEKSETERKRSKDAVPESEAKIRALLHVIPDLVFCISRNGIFLDYKPVEGIDLYVPPEVFLGKKIDEVLPADVAQIAMRYIEQTLQTGEAQQFEYRLLIQGIMRDYEARSVVSGKDEVIAIIRDITERKQAEDALKLYRDIFYHSNDGIAIINPQGFYLEQNPAHRKLIVYSGEELKGKTPAIHLGDETFSKIIEELTKKGVYRGEITSYTKLAEKKDIELSAFAITNKNAEVICFVGIKRDITEHKQAQEKLQNLSRRLTEVQEADHRFLASELHDQVGQKLTALSINLNIIRGQFSDEFDKKIIDRLEDSLELVEETIERIRDVMAELRPPVLDDYGLLVAVRWYSERFSERTGIATMLQGKEFSPRLPLVVEAALFRIFQEVLTNVAKHAQARQVSVILDEVGGIVQLTITDDGVGFDPAALRQLKEQPRWGLITIEERAKALGGNVHVKSAPGERTQVIVQLPC